MFAMLECSISVWNFFSFLWFIFCEYMVMISSRFISNSYHERNNNLLSWPLGIFCDLIALQQWLDLLDHINIIHIRWLYLNSKISSSSMQLFLALYHLCGAPGFPLRKYGTLIRCWRSYQRYAYYYFLGFHLILDFAINLFLVVNKESCTIVSVLTDSAYLMDSCNASIHKEKMSCSSSFLLFFDMDWSSITFARSR